ncbi:hypothetical protein [Janthinobacterium sp. NKUCC08_JDC]|uniref:hypothetical protein n=1 Tax=Janthinobacterium sp. NKUCC08_JDC TaxID=2842122 RepID=UPI001C5B78ED|nr:hypothetical protein [Janthinobacterium sp. NKUCC08_JDC]MBW3497747.1 hypothetical protein [Janthinobacterium sp. NKUCC08_JDC]
MNFLLKYLVALSVLSCSSPRPEAAAKMLQVGQSTFSLAARYGTPTSYQRQGDYLQLNYGSDMAGCQLIVLIDQAQRVAGWASAGKLCPVR